MIYDIFPNFNIFPEITYIEVFKRALWLKKAILMNFFPGKKGHFATKKRALPKLGGPGPPAPRFLRP